MSQPRTTHILITIMLLSSCVHKNTDKGTKEIEQDSLRMFPVGSWMTFVSTNEHDQIALAFKRDSSNTFKYRIELLRKWKGLPHDYGEVQIDKIESDSVYIFKGRNTDCEVEILVYNGQGEFKLGQQYVKLKRNCKDNSLDIALDEFPKLWHK